MRSSKTIFVSGSSGLIGSSVCEHFAALGWRVHGVDSNQRAVFFGPEGDTTGNRRRLEARLPEFHHHDLDVRDRDGLMALFRDIKPSAIVHAAAQPSHDLAARIPFADFDTNAVGTLNMLEAARNFAAEAPFVFLSTNKVYGDVPNEIPVVETKTRWTWGDPAYAKGISETMRIDQSLHSVFGASKVAADIMVQEYGRYFRMPTCCLRAGCLTGPAHAGVEFHGFLSYLGKCVVSGRPYQINGYKGKQVRDNIHAKDVAAFCEAFIKTPRCAEVYNIGGGFQNSCSIIEALDVMAGITGRKPEVTYKDEPRMGDHICYFSDLTKIMGHYPEWRVRITMGSIIEGIIHGWRDQLGAKGGNGGSL